MSDGEEYHVFVGNLSWTTTDRILEDAFIKFCKIANAKVVCDKYLGRSRGFVFVTFDIKDAIEEAIEKMNGMDLDSRAITVDRAHPGGGRGDGSGGRDRDCFKCGKPGHLAQEYPSGDGGDIFGGNMYEGGGSRDCYFGSSRDGGGCDCSAPYGLPR